MVISYDFLGYLAAFCTTTAFIPQALKTIQTRDTRALSLGMYSILTLGLILWVLYGTHKGDLSIILANAVTGMISMVILFQKVRNDVWKKKNKIATPLRSA